VIASRKSREAKHAETRRHRSGTAGVTDSQLVVARTRRWIERIVIGLGLCPFARSPFDAGRIRFVVSAALDDHALARDLESESRRLVSTDRAELETTLLIHPLALTEFLEFNDFLDVADALLDDLDLADEIQIASFHPRYQFGDAPPDAIENATNRSPYPMLHLLRRSSVERAIAAFGDTSKIFTANVATLRSLGADNLRALNSDDD
jgi:hypothetical protein